MRRGILWQRNYDEIRRDNQIDCKRNRETVVALFVESPVRTKYYSTNLMLPTSPPPSTTSCIIGNTMITLLPIFSLANIIHSILI